MNERDTLIYWHDNLARSLQGLEDVLVEPVDSQRYIVDATTQRFKVIYELCWKTFKRFLSVEGVIAKSPRQTLREAYQLGWIDDEQEWLQMLEDRNLTSHVYRQETADEIFGRIPNHAKAIRQAFSKLPTV